MLWQRKTEKIDLVRVIRDARDATRDYYISRLRAEKLYAEGKLSQVQCYSQGWDYYSHNRTIK